MQNKDNNAMDNKEKIGIKYSWEVEEYTYYERSKNWYIIAVTTALLLLLFSFLSGNFLFSMIVIIFSLIIILHDGRKPDMVLVELTSDGVQIGRKQVLFEELSNFSIVYKPKSDIKNLYFEYKNSLKQRISIPLKNVDPLQIRNFLLKYIPEDLERIGIPASEALAKILKL